MCSLNVIEVGGGRVIGLGRDVFLWTVRGLDALGVVRGVLMFIMIRGGRLFSCFFRDVIYLFCGEKAFWVGVGSRCYFIYWTGRVYFGAISST